MKKQITFFQNQLLLFAEKKRRFGLNSIPLILLMFITSMSYSQITVDCAAGPVNTTYCYVDNDTTQFIFTNTDGFPLNVYFNAGQVENGFDELIVLDTDGVTDLNAATPYGNNGDLTGITYQSSGDTITIQINSDSVISCSTNAFTPWDFDVWCQSCLNPTVSFATNGDCTNGNDFSILVDVSDMGSATELLINDDQGSPQQNVTTTGVYTFGPYTATTDVIITVNDANDVNCEVVSGTISCLSGGPGSLFVNAGNDVVLDCAGVTCTDITATFLATFESMTENYTVEPITYDPPFSFNGLANSINTNIDDAWSNVEDLPFDFCFFQNIETQFQVGSNGGVRFEVDPNDTYNGWAFSENLPNNTNETLSEVNVFTPVHDIDPSVNGTNEIAWEILGTFPNRVLVVSYYKVPYFSCNDLEATHMAVFYEFSNVVEVYIQDKPTCDTWNSGNAVVGIQNNAGTIAYVPPGRNTSDSPWTTNDEAWSFSPAGAPTYVFEWLDADGNFISNNPTINVCPVGTEVYTAQITYTNCNGDVVVLTDDVSVTVVANFTVDLGGDQSLCDETSYEITTTITGDDPTNATYLWSTGETTDSITVTTSGDYTVDVTIDGCTVTETVNIFFGESPIIDLGEDFQTCFFEPVTLDASPSNLDPASVTYVWSLNGTEIIGENSPTLSVTEIGTYSVVVTNGNCSTEEIINVNPSDDLGVDLGEDFVTCLNKPTPGRIYAYPDADIPGTPTFTWYLDRLDGNGFQLLDYTTGSIPVLELGTYRVEVTIGVCVDTDEITASARGLTAHLGPDIVTCPDQSQTLTATSGGYGELTYKWFLDDVEIEGETSDTLNVPEDSEGNIIPGTYMVEISAGVCSQTAEVEISYYSENGCVITQGISPNGDGYNDNMDLRFLADRSGIANFQVFNRHGLLVYSMSNYRRQWGGGSNINSDNPPHDNKKLPVGTYYYVIDLANDDPVYGRQVTGWVYINQEEN